MADFMVTLANGTQTGGSVIGPAASNGVYGFKASLNGIDRAGFRHCKGGIDTIGLFARAMEDLILLRSVNVGEDPGEFIDGKSHPRLALVRTAAWDQTEPCSRQAIAIAVDMLKDAGADVNDLELPELFSQITGDFGVVNAWEGAHALQFEVQNHFSEFNDHNNERVLFARTLTLADYETSRTKLAAARAEMDRLASRYDLFLTPSLPGEAPVGTLQVRNAVFNRLWTQMYMPAVNLPLFEGPNGMPVNLQLIGREHSDCMTLLWAQWVDQRLRERLAGVPMAL